MNRRRTLPLRTIILIPFVLQLLATVGFVSWIFFRSERDAVHNLTGQLREEISQRVEIRLNSYLNAPRTINQITANAIELDQLSIDDLATMQRHFWQQSLLFPDVDRQLSLYEVGEQGERGTQASTRSPSYEIRMFALGTSPPRMQMALSGSTCTIGPPLTG